MRSGAVSVIVLAIIVATPALAQGIDWPGLPPDCWTESRIYHSEELDYGWRDRTVIEAIDEPKPEAGEYSANRAYFFVRAANGNGSPITIFAEKDHLIRISFPDADSRYVVTARWINENLLYLRPAWGRIAFTDIVFDVETEEVVYAKDATDGQIAMEQARETCRRVGGCDCIRRDQAGASDLPNPEIGAR